MIKIWVKENCTNSQYVVIFCKLLLDSYFLSPSILLGVLFTYIIKTGLTFRVSDQVLHPNQAELKLKSFHWKFVVEEMALGQVVSPNEVVSSPLPPSCCPANAPFPYTLNYYRNQSEYWKRHKLNHIPEKNCNFYLTFICPCIASIYLKYDGKMQRVLDLFISISCSTCFWRFLRPSSRAQNCTYSVRYCQTNTAACCYRGWDGTACVWRFLRPSSGAQNCTYSVRYCQTNTAACCYRG